MLSLPNLGSRGLVCTNTVIEVHIQSRALKFILEFRKYRKKLSAYPIRSRTLEFFFETSRKTQYLFNTPKNYIYIYFFFIGNCFLFSPLDRQTLGEVLYAGPGSSLYQSFLGFTRTTHKQQIFKRRTNNANLMFVNY